MKFGTSSILDRYHANSNTYPAHSGKCYLYDKILASGPLSHSMNTKTKKVTRTRLDHSLSWQTILYNCECHTFDEVIEQLMLAIKCTEATASQYAYIVHNLGSASVFKGEKEECERVSDILGSIGLNVKVTQ